MNMVRLLTMNFIRHCTGKVYQWVDRLVPVRVQPRTKDEVDLLERESRRMHLYVAHSCPASIGVQRYCDRLGLRVVRKDVQRVNAYRNELLNGGGEPVVPCLRIENEQGIHWLYNSSSILEFLEQKFRFY